MSEMNELSELYEESTDLQMDVIPGESDLPHMEVGGGSRELSPNPFGGRPNAGGGSPANEGATGAPRPR